MYVLLNSVFLLIRDVIYRILIATLITSDYRGSQCAKFHKIIESSWKEKY